MTRKVTSSIPPRVDYELTPLGHSLRGPVCTLSQWAIDNIAAIHGAQGALDEAGELERAALFACERCFLPFVEQLADLIGRFSAGGVPDRPFLLSGRGIKLVRKLHNG